MAKWCVCSEVEQIRMQNTRKSVGKFQFLET